MVKSRYIGDGHPTFNRSPYNWYIKPYYWVDDHPLLYGNNGSLDPSTCSQCSTPMKSSSSPLKNDGWKTIHSFWGPVTLQGRTVKPRGCRYKTYHYAWYEVRGIASFRKPHAKAFPPKKQPINSNGDTRIWPNGIIFHQPRFP